MKILFVWSGLTGYTGDCWRELAGRGDVELKVVVDTGETVFGGGFRADEVMRGLDWSTQLPTRWKPDVIFTVGWRNALCRSVVSRTDWADVPKVCCFDMPWRWQLRCVAARFLLHSYLRHFAAAFVPGRAAHRYARWLGVRRVYDGLFSTNTRRFGHHAGGGGFLFVGRDVADKGTDILREAHARYRAKGGELPLRIVSGVSPDALGEIYAAADCFVLASRWEPWGVVLVEAAAAGLPIICTDACGARHELVKDGVNGFVVKRNSVEALTDAMLNWRKLDGSAGRIPAEDFSCSTWATRVVKFSSELASDDISPSATPFRR